MLDTIRAPRTPASKFSRCCSLIALRSLVSFQLAAASHSGEGCREGGGIGPRRAVVSAKSRLLVSPLCRQGPTSERVRCPTFRVRALPLWGFGTGECRDLGLLRPNRAAAD